MKQLASRSFHTQFKEFRFTTLEAGLQETVEWFEARMARAGKHPLDDSHDGERTLTDVYDVSHDGRHVLVTGGAGYIGLVLCKQLLERGFRVTVLDTFLYRQNSLLDCCAYDGFQIVRGDCPMNG